MTSYHDLGVRPVINAFGTLTTYGNSLMSTEVLTAMAEASRAFVSMDELQQAAGRRIAELIGVEAACVSSGATGGLALAGAACIAGMDPGKRQRLPDASGMRNEIVVFRSMRSNYELGFRLAGATIVEAGMILATELWELEHAITDNTSAVSWFVAHESAGMLPLDLVVKTAHARGVPVIVDAASEIPPIENLRKYADMGVDLTVFSGGKGLRGPSSTGLVIGKKPLINACVFHACPNYGIGRAMKVGKEEIVGLVAAIESCLGQDEAAQMAIWEQQVASIMEALTDIPGLTARRICPVEQGVQPTGIPRVFVQWERTVSAHDTVWVKTALLAGDPRVLVGCSATDLIINPQTLQKGEEAVIASCIRRQLLSP